MAKMEYFELSSVKKKQTIWNCKIQYLKSRIIKWFESRPHMLILYLYQIGLVNAKKG